MFKIPKITYGGFIPTEIRFTYPPKELKAEKFTPSQKTAESISGVVQTSTNYIEGTRSFQFSFLTEAQKAQLETFMLTYALYGNFFKYYPDKNAGEYFTVQLDKRVYDPKKIASVGIDVYIYEVQVDIRRVLDEEISEGFMEQEILNDQSSPVDITGFVLDKDSYKTARCFYEIFRKTDDEERVANGQMVFTYKESTGLWVANPGTFEAEEVHGVTFGVDADGQVNYVSDDMPGANYESNLLLRNFTIIGG